MNPSFSASLPLPTARAARALIYPFSQLTAIGHSLTVPGDVNVKRFTAAAHAYAKRHGWTASVRRLPDGNLCVWRVSDSRAEAKAAVEPVAYPHGMPYALSSTTAMPSASHKPVVQRPPRETAAQRRGRESELAQFQSASRILAYIATAPGQTPSDVVDALKMEFHEFAIGLKWLRQQGLIRSQLDGTLVAQAPQSKPVTP